MKNGLFVVFDGQDGTGKSTIVSEVALKLKDMNYKVNVTKEPTFGPIGSLIRENNFDGFVLANLIAADRLYHIEYEILPALEQGEIVISDRYVASSYVCQQLDGVPLEYIQQINTNVLRPDISIFILADKSEVSKRLSERSQLARMEIAYCFQDTADLYAQSIALYRDNNFGKVMELTNNKMSELENNVLAIVHTIDSEMREYS